MRDDGAKREEVQDEKGEAIWRQEILASIGFQPTDLSRQIAAKTGTTRAVMHRSIPFSAPPSTSGIRLIKGFQKESRPQNIEVGLAYPRIM